MRQSLLSPQGERQKSFGGRAVRANGVASFLDTIGLLFLLRWPLRQKARLAPVRDFTVSGEP